MRSWVCDFWEQGRPELPRRAPPLRAHVGLSCPRSAWPARPGLRFHSASRCGLGFYPRNQDLTSQDAPFPGAHFSSYKYRGHNAGRKPSETPEVPHRTPREWRKSGHRQRQMLARVRGSRNAGPSLLGMKHGLFEGGCWSPTKLNRPLPPGSAITLLGCTQRG